MKLPRQALIERLGPEAGKWHDLLHGKTCRLLRLHRLPESFAHSFDFEDGVIALDPLVFALKRLLHTLAGRLGARHLAADSLHFRLILESFRPDSFTLHPVAVSAPWVHPDCPVPLHRFRHLVGPHRHLAAAGVGHPARQPPPAAARFPNAGPLAA